jgi:hypothetical protein
MDVTNVVLCVEVVKVSSTVEVAVLLSPARVTCCSTVVIVVDMGILLWMQEQPADTSGAEIVATRDMNGIAATVGNTGAASRLNKTTYDVDVVVTVAVSISVL